MLLLLSIIRWISVIVVSASRRIDELRRAVGTEVLDVEDREGEVGVAVEGQVRTEAVLVDQLRDELRGESDDESLNGDRWFLQHLLFLAYYFFLGNFHLDSFSRVLVR